MGAVTGIELGPGSCVLVRARQRESETAVSSIYGLQPEESRGPQVELRDYLQRIRREMRFPARARVVAWGLHPPASIDDAGTGEMLRPLQEAGFRVDEVLSPSEALALLARQRPRAAGRAGTAWLALNRHGAAIAIVGDGQLRFSKEFEWQYQPRTTTREELLQRYTLIAHLAPELRHGIEVVRQQGHPVDAIVTCGDLPDLRSLTMPLIEELDMEVETLDTLDGLDVEPVIVEAIGDRAPAMRLAAAAAMGRSPANESSHTRVMAAAAALVLLAALGWGTMRVVTTDDAADPPRAVAPGPAEPARPAQADGPAAPPTIGRAVVASPESDRPAGESAPAEATTGRAGPSGNAGNQGLAAEGSSGPSRDAGVSAPDLTRPAAEPVPRARTPRSAAVRPEAPLTDPLPVVNSILVAPDRRIAVVDGAIVREGDAVGARVLIRIEPDAVLLREPSGHQVRVPLRRRVNTDAGVKPPAVGIPDIFRDEGTVSCVRRSASV